MVKLFYYYYFSLTCNLYNFDFDGLSVFSDFGFVIIDFMGRSFVFSMRHHLVVWSRYLFFVSIGLYASWWNGMHQ